MKINITKLKKIFKNQRIRISKSYVAIGSFIINRSFIHSQDLEIIKKNSLSVYVTTDTEIEKIFQQKSIENLKPSRIYTEIAGIKVVYCFSRNNVILINKDYLDVFAKDLECLTLLKDTDSEKTGYWINEIGTGYVMPLFNNNISIYQIIGLGKILEKNN